MRVITRLDETCREVRDAARVIGDAELFKKMEEAQIKIKRDSTYSLSNFGYCAVIISDANPLFLPVVFAASLYF